MSPNLKSTESSYKAREEEAICWRVSSKAKTSSSGKKKTAYLVNCRIRSGTLRNREPNSGSTLINWASQKICLRSSPDRVISKTKI